MANEIRYFNEFQDCFDDLLSHIDLAKSRVWLETYCLDQSPPARRLLATLTKAALRGTQCILCVDAVGSIGCLPKQDLAIFRQAGGKLCVWNPFRIFHRNHRKLAVCDNTLYCMSGNFDKRSCILMEARCKLPRRPPDINNGISIRGPVAMEGIESVCRTIRKCRLPFTRKALPKKAGWVPEGSSCERSNRGTPYGNIKAKWLESEGAGAASGWLRPVNSYREALTSALDRATHHIFVASAYFQPPKFLRKRLASATERGVGVEILVSGKSDIVGDLPATEFTLRRHLFRKPLVWRTLARHLHTKTLIVDKSVTVFGSYNWDRFSARRNREAGIMIVNAPLASRVINDLSGLPREQMLKDADSLFRRAKQWLCYHALRITARTRVVGSLET